jgi:hypothetical protein
MAAKTALLLVIILDAKGGGRFNTGTTTVSIGAAASWTLPDS